MLGAESSAVTARRSARRRPPCGTPHEYSRKRYLSRAEILHIGSFCHIASGASRITSDLSGLPHSVMLYTRSHDCSGASMTNPMVPAAENRPKEGQIVLGRHAIIGAGTVVLPGVTFDEGSAVGAPVAGQGESAGLRHLRGRSGTTDRLARRALLEREAELMATARAQRG
jgi:acetyltransferase-like isoleucine patch superfamily enzyme